MSRRAIQLGLIGVLALVGTALVGIMPAFADTIVVHPGQSIQRAVHRAHDGDTIVVEAGVYHENVLIQGKSHLTLQGAGATDAGTVLMPPPGSVEKAAAKNNRCAREQSGICVFGAGATTVDGTTVTGFQVTGFAGFGIIAAGTTDSTFDHNAAINDGEYGMASFASSGNSYTNNVAVGSQEAGFYYGDSPEANGTFDHNISKGNLFGFFLRDSAHGTLTNNVATGNCDGYLFLDTGEGPVDGGWWSARENSAIQNNEFCPSGEDAPAISGLGMAIVGDDGVVLKHNLVSGNHPTGAADVAGGIVVISAEPFGGSVENDNRVVDNVAHHNKPKDVIWDGNGSGNVFKGNDCGTSHPARICT
jgi:parallel beta-helix repeat protein